MIQPVQRILHFAQSLGFTSYFLTLSILELPFNMQLTIGVCNCSASKLTSLCACGQWGMHPGGKGEIRGETHGCVYTIRTITPWSHTHIVHRLSSHYLRSYSMKTKVNPMLLRIKLSYSNKLYSIHLNYTIYTCLQWSVMLFWYK